jgi:hypothetical protein
MEEIYEIRYHWRKCYWWNMKLDIIGEMLEENMKLGYQ